jgi:phage repressor protein C with HTH and peptisase S24 domain
LFGLAAGSGKGFEKMSEDAIDWVDCPPALANVKDAYCLYVTGNSMVPRYFSGELVFVNPHRLAREGDVVVIQTQIHAQAPVEAAIKVFKDRTKTHIITSQYNPPGDVTFARKHTIGLHRVLTNNELFGL